MSHYRVAVPIIYASDHPAFRIEITCPYCGVPSNLVVKQMYGMQLVDCKDGCEARFAVDIKDVMVDLDIINEGKVAVAGLNG